MKTAPITEHTHQCAVIKWSLDMVKYQTKKYWMLEYLYAVPNGARVARSTANKLKAEGMKGGVPDLVLPFPIKGSFAADYTGAERINALFGRPFYSCPGLYIELKSRDTKGRLSDDQKRWIAYLSEQGYKVEVCWSADEAIKVLEDYLDE